MSTLNHKIGWPTWRRRKMKMINAGHYMNDETFLSYALMSLPQDEYQKRILVLKGYLRKGTLTIEMHRIYWMINLNP